MPLLWDFVTTIGVEFVRHLQHPVGYKPHPYQQLNDPRKKLFMDKLVCRGLQNNFRGSSVS